MSFAYLWILFVHSEETNDQSKPSLEVTRNVPIEDPEPVQTVSDTSSQVAETSVKPKYRLVQFGASLIAVGGGVSLIAVHVFQIWFLWKVETSIGFSVFPFILILYLLCSWEDCLLAYLCLLLHVLLNKYGCIMIKGYDY